MIRQAALFAALGLMTACGDPLGDFPRLSEVELADTGTTQALPSEAEIARDGFFGTDAATAETPGVTDPVTETAEAPAEPTGGFWGLLRRNLPQAPADVATAEVPEAEVEATEDPVTLASLPDTAAPEVPVTDAPPARSGGFLSRLIAPTAAVEPESTEPEVDYGTVLPYGVIARNCAAKRQPLGRKVESVSASGFKLYDSNPRTTGPRTFYITGFDDGCPRQLTASHVLLGTPGLYELLHYGPTGKHLAFGETDAAYEKVKARVCGARKGRPCGSKLKSLERSTFFVNAYARPDDNRSWAEMLVHDGKVMATSMKSSG